MGQQLTNETVKSRIDIPTILHSDLVIEQANRKKEGSIILLPDLLVEAVEKGMQVILNERKKRERVHG